MGWDEAQYIIDELVPLYLEKGQISEWIADYKMWGTDSYVYNIPYMLDTIYLSEEGVNDLTVNIEGLDYAINKGGIAFNTWLCNLAVTKDQAATLFADVLTPEDLGANENAVAAVLNNPIALNAILVNETLLAAIVTSEATITAIAENETLLTAIVTSEAAMINAARSAQFLNNMSKTAVIRKAFASSQYMQGLLDIIADTVKDANYFTLKEENVRHQSIDSTYYINGDTLWETTEVNADASFVFVSQVYTEHATLKSTVTGLLLSDTIQGTAAGWTDVPYLFIGGLKSKPYSASSSYDEHGVKTTVYVPV